MTYEEAENELKAEVEALKANVLDKRYIEQSVTIKALEKAIEALKRVKNNEWIKCNDRQPTGDPYIKYYMMVKMKNGLLKRAIGKYNYSFINGWEYQNGFEVKKEVVAWANIPTTEKYKEDKC